MALTHLRRVSVLLPLCAALGCAAHGPKEAKHATKGIAAHKSEPGTLEGPAAPPIPAFAIGSMDNDASPAAVARRGTDGVVVLDRGGHLYAQRFDTKTGVTGSSIDLGTHAPLAPGALGIEAKSDGYVVVWDEQVDQNHGFKVLGLDREGKPTGPSLSLPPLAEHVTLVGLIAAGDGFLVVHEQSHEGTSDVYVTPIDPTIKRTLSGAQLVAQGALGWNATRGSKEASFAVVAGPAANTDGEILGHVEAFGVDAAGKKSATVPLTTAPVADIDVEIATVEGATLVAWTDHTDAEAAVRFATLQGGKVVTPPKRASTPLGEEALMGLVADPSGAGKRALIAWENVGEQSGEARHVEVGTIAADGRVSSERSTFLLDAQGRPDFVADRDGFAIVTLAPATVEQGPAATVHADTPVWPTYVRLGSDLAVTGGEPVRFLGTRSRQGIPDLTHSLACDAGDCSLLAASNGAPTELYLALLPARSSPWHPVAWRTDGGKPPLVREVRTLWEGDSISQVAATKIGGTQPTTLATWVTYFVDGTSEVEAPPKGEAPFAATLGVRAVRDDGTMSDPILLSRRAFTEGGVAIAQGPTKARGEAVVGWVASEKTGPQVYVTKIDADGKKTAQKKLTVLTRTKGNGKTAAPTSSASSVAIAYAPAAAPTKRIEFSSGKHDEKLKDKPKKESPKGSGGSEKGGKSGDGFIVGWVDTRDKNGEVYVARINRDLDKTVVDKRITNAEGDASDVRILVHGSDTFVVYSDARGQDQGDIYVAHLDTQTLATIDAEGRVYASATHSRSPKLTLAGDRIMLGWIEEGAQGEGGVRGKATLHLAELDPLGRLVTTPTILDVDGSVTSFELACSGATFATCRGVVSSELDGQVSLGGFSLGVDGKPGPTRRLYHLTTAALTDVSPAFTDAMGSGLLLLEEAGRGRARLMGIDW